MKIQRLLSDELHRIRRLGKMFSDEVNLAGGYDPDRFEPVWNPLMETGLADVFYAEDSAGELIGFLGASYIPDLYSGLRGAQSQFWYVDPAHRKGSLVVRLFNAFEAEAQARRTQKYIVGHKSGINEPAMREFFLRRGYVLGEYIFWKNLI